MDPAAGRRPNSTLPNLLPILTRGHGEVGLEDCYPLLRHHNAGQRKEGLGLAGRLVAECGESELEAQLPRLLPALPHLFADTVPEVRGCSCSSLSVGE